jgi:probable addiction module antidote protein
MLANSKAISAKLFRDNPAEIATYLTEIFKENDFNAARTSLGLVMQAQNVQMLARDAGLRRDTLYRTFGGRIDPQLSRTLRLFDGLNVEACVVPLDHPGAQNASAAVEETKAYAKRLSQAFAGNRYDQAVLALREIALSQSVTALARASGIPRRTIYRTFGGKVDPQLSRVLKLLAGLQLRLAVIALPHRRRAPRPKLGHPSKQAKPV